MVKVTIKIRREVIEKGKYKANHKVWTFLPPGVNEAVIEKAKYFSALAQVNIHDDDYVVLPGGGSLLAYEVDVLK